MSEAGAFVYCRHKETQSNALHVAISNKHYNVATQLIKSNFPVNYKNHVGITPLLILANDLSAQSIKLCYEILKHNCNLEDQNINGYTALGLCVIYKNIEVAKMLINKGAEMFIS